AARSSAAQSGARSPAGHPLLPPSIASPAAARAVLSQRDKTHLNKVTKAEVDLTLQPRGGTPRAARSSAAQSGARSPAGHPPLPPAIASPAAARAVLSQRDKPRR